jgi:[DsrC]-trisulfide reductase subunit J
MKFYNRGIIIAGIVVFVLITTFPFWYGRGKVALPPDLQLDTPVIQQLTDRRCVEATPFMRSNHMKLLIAWRDSVVRDGGRLYVAKDGRTFEISLTGTCLKCHDNKSQFCDRCHDYVEAKPTCWNCHNIPGEVRR